MFIFVKATSVLSIYLYNNNYYYVLMIGIDKVIIVSVISEKKNLSTLKQPVDDCLLHFVKNKILNKRLRFAAQKFQVIFTCKSF